ncbi:hypothetical protein MLD38_022681 [Melastoma candidum]|uniref:Uncharacterized protein n=1 Tax=Melastoma candidum TaxID=119954 RepID=A0ACB9QK49_9MYRT|nr:hypothetical protein MLD38_022681 [Melastoma candidum]
MEKPGGTRAPPQPTIPVDEDGRATSFRPFTASSPHMLAFHLAWLSLFSNFFSTFSIPPLLPVIRHDLGLTPEDIGRAGIASFAGAILSRFVMGPVCDAVGPRVASASLSLLTAPFVLSAGLVTGPGSFILVRFLVGFSIANFVSNQFWISSMFAPSVVGLANGVSAGWANVGSGLTQLVMPLVFHLLTNAFHVSSHTAWRASFVVPALFQTMTAFLVLSFGQDMPRGTFRQHKPIQPQPHQANHFHTVNNFHDKNPNSNFNSNNNNGDDDDDSIWAVLWNGLSNYRGWILALTYGYSFGAELTTDNVIAGYFYERFGVGVQTAGVLAALFGTANCISRPMGGVVSDEMGRRFGMRGRLWALWVTQTAAGVACVALGRAGSLSVAATVVCCFGLLVQAAAGMTFGIVPFVSKRSLGVVSGLTGSGGTTGAVVMQLLLFSGSQRFSKETGISLMGLMIIAFTLPIALVRFPRLGGMFRGPSLVGQEVSSEEHYRLLPR